MMDQVPNLPRHRPRTSPCSPYCLGRHRFIIISVLVMVVTNWVLSEYDLDIMLHTTYLPLNVSPQLVMIRCILLLFEAIQYYNHDNCSIKNWMRLNRTGVKRGTDIFLKCNLVAKPSAARTLRNKVLSPTELKYCFNSESKSTAMSSLLAGQSSGSTVLRSSDPCVGLDPLSRLSRPRPLGPLNRPPNLSESSELLSPLDCRDQGCQIYFHDEAQVCNPWGISSLVWCSIYVCIHPHAVLEATDRHIYWCITYASIPAHDTYIGAYFFRYVYICIHPNTLLEVADRHIYWCIFLLNMCAYASIPTYF